MIAFHAYRVFKIHGSTGPVQSYCHGHSGEKTIFDLPKGWFGSPYEAEAYRKVMLMSYPGADYVVHEICIEVVS